MLARTATCSQLHLGDEIERNVHTARFKGRKCSYRPLERVKCSHPPTLDCPRLTTLSHAMRLFPPIWTQNVVCTSSDMVAMWLAWIPPSPRSGRYTSHVTKSPPCRPWNTIYYNNTFGYNAAFHTSNVVREFLTKNSTNVQSEGNNHTTKINVFSVLHTIFILLGRSKNGIACLAGGNKIHFMTR